MSSETFSLLLWCWYDRLTSTTQLRIVRTDTAEEVYLSDSTFLLRISTDEQTQIQRCLIRHIASGREAYVQGGPNLRAFIKDCLLQSGGSEPADTPKE